MKKISAKFIGIFFVVWGCAAILKSIYVGKYEQILWACWIGFILLGIGILRKDAWFTTSQLNILAIPWLFWSGDFIYRVFSGKSLLGITDYVFAPIPAIDLIITLAHIIALPIALIALYRLQLKRADAWKLSLVQLALLFVITITFTTNTIDNKINCIYNPCIPSPINLPFPLAWIIGSLIIVFLTNAILVKLFHSKKP